MTCACREERGEVVEPCEYHARWAEATASRLRGALQVIHQWASHDLGSLTGTVCKLTCPVCVARRALGYPGPGTPRDAGKTSDLRKGDA